MIIIFHCLCTFLSKLCQTFSIRTRKPILCYDIYQHSKTRFHPLAIKDSKGNISFDPLLSVQRYDRVSDILRNESAQVPIKKLVEFGCGSFSLFKFIKNVPGIEDMVFVDIDKEVVKDHLYRVEPMLHDYVRKRDARLRLNVFKGSVSEPDPCLAGSDAVVAVELIEHLYPDTLEAVPYNIFGYIKPSLVVITTPNSEFNVLFPDFAHRKFRNLDHKFEWTRAEFQDWATNVSVRFPKYKVYFDGIGEAPSGHEVLGCCSQAAIFIRDDTICDTIIQCKCSFQHCDTEKDKLLCCCVCENCSPLHSYGVCTWNSCSESSSGHNFYELVTNIEFPYEIDTRSEEQKTLDEIKYRISSFGFMYNPYYNAERNRSEIPLEVVAVRRNGEPPVPVSEVRNLLLKDDDYKVEECIVGENKTLCAIYDHDMETGGSGSNTEASGYESDAKYPATLSDHQALVQEEGEISDWDKDDDDEDVESKDAVSQAEALIDSGYQKSQSSAENSPQADAIFKNFSGAAATVATPLSPPPLPLRNEASSAASSNFPNVPPPINRTIPANPNKLSNLLSVFDKFSVDKVNELDAMRNERRYFHIAASNMPHKEAMRKICQEIAKHSAVNHHQAGPSNIQRKTKSRKVPPSLSSDSDDCSSVEDVKCITNCILENTLNSIELKEDKQKNKGHLIKDYQNIEEQAPVLIHQAVVQAAQEIIAAAALPPPPVAGVPAPAPPPPPLGGGGAPGPAELPLLPVVVENGDLANNNRDREGNNMRPNHRHRDEDEAAAAIVIENVDNNNQDHEGAAMMAAVLHHAAGVAGHDDNNGVRIDEIRVVAEGGEVENDEQDPLRGGGVELAWSSREALFDSSSQMDMLEEFDLLESLPMGGIIVAVNIDDGPNADNDESLHVAHLSLNNHHHRRTKPTLNDQFQPGPPVLLPDENDFPNWLLQIFDENETIEEGEQTEDAHFFCQGDGLGVHPTVGDINDGEEGDEEDSSSDSSTSGSVEFVNAEDAPSHVDMAAQTQDETNVQSPAAEGLATELVVIGIPLGHQLPPTVRESSSVRSSSDHEEFFETAEELDSSSTSTTSGPTESA